MDKRLLPLLLVVVLCACKPSSRASLGADIAHANGLVAAAPEGWEAQATESGFVFVEAGDLRSPQQIHLDLVSEPPDVAGLRRRGWGGGWGGEQVRYGVRELGAAPAAPSTS